ncbi:hypothetical protein AB5I41_05080 [Sphingomonas sp. MMS24-JH45]
MVFARELEENLHVCPTCDHHERIGPKERFAQLLDEGTAEVLIPPCAAEDPLKFRDFSGTPTG